MTAYRFRERDVRGARRDRKGRQDRRHGLADLAGSVRSVARYSLLLQCAGILVALGVIAISLVGIDGYAREAHQSRSVHSTLVADLDELDSAVTGLRGYEQDIVIRSDPSARARAFESWKNSLEQAIALLNDLVVSESVTSELSETLAVERDAIESYAQGARPVLERVVGNESADPQRAALALVPVAPYMRDVETAVRDTRAAIREADQTVAAEALREADLTRSRLVIAGGLLALLLIGLGVALHRRTMRAAARLAAIGSTDPLTGLLNRTGLRDSVERATADQPVGDDQHLGCLYINIDHFLLAVEMTTPDRADELLWTIADRLEAIAEPHDHVARVGSDRFAIVARRPAMADLEALARGALYSIRQLSVSAGGHVFPLTASIGIAALAPSDRSFGALLAAAEAAHVAAQEQGRDRFHVVEGTNEFDGSTAQRLLEQAQQVKALLERGELRLRRQPLVSLSSQRDGCELVLDAVDPTTGKSIPRAAILPAAEAFGLMESIDRWSMTAAVLLLEAGYLPAVERAHLRLASSSIRKPEFRAFVIDTIERHSVAGPRLSLEIGESVLNAAPDDVTELSGALHELGAAVTIGEFGSEVGSLGRLDLVGVDSVRIRHRLLDEFGDTEPLVRALVAIASDRGLFTIAPIDGDASLIGDLRDLGVDSVVGTAVAASEPIDAGELWRLAVHQSWEFASNEGDVR